jgi:hypothetical protein
MAQLKMPNEIPNIFKQDFSFNHPMIRSFCVYVTNFAGKGQRSREQLKYCKRNVKIRLVIDFFSYSVSLTGGTMKIPLYIDTNKAYLITPLLL